MGTLRGRVLEKRKQSLSVSMFVVDVGTTLELYTSLYMGLCLVTPLNVSARVTRSEIPFLPDTRSC